MRLVSVHRYPVKSMRGQSLADATVEPWGLSGDRRWMVIDRDDRFLTARVLPKLLLLTPILTDDGLVLTWEGRSSEVIRPVGAIIEVTIWRDQVKATLAGAAGNRWLSDVLGTDLRLVFLDDPTRRPVSPDHSDPADRVSFADGYPLLLTSATSLRELNGWITTGRHPQDGPMPMERFRPSVVIDDVAPWAEDDWSRLRIGGTEFRSVKPCARCVITTTDPATAVRGHEPLSALAQHRNIDGGLLFGVNLIPDTAGGTLTVGDPVEVLG